jgi:hypothetical protein
MSLLGKILAILNVLAALGFVYLAAVDWGKRNAWAYAVFRHELVVDGLPVDESESVPVEDVPVVDRLSENTLQDLFRQAGGQPVKTQREAVKRLHDELRAKVESAGDENAQRQALYTLLEPLARTFGERELLAQEILQKKDKSLSELLGDFDALFQTKDGAKGTFAGLMPKHERQAIAHLLFSLSPDVAQHGRIQVVIGLKEFADEVSRQADALRRMSDQVRLDITRDRGTFAERYQDLVEDIRHRAQVLEDRLFDKRNQLRVKGEHEQLLASRRKEIADIHETMETTRASINKILDAQAKEEKAVFDAQRLYRTTKADNERMERDIRTLEKVGTEGQP